MKLKNVRAMLSTVPPRQASKRRQVSLAALALSAAVALVGCATTAETPGAAPNADKPMEKILVVVPSASATHAIPKFAEEQGFFEEAGLDVEVSIVASGQSISALAGGTAQFMVTAAPAPDAAALKGPIVVLGNFADRPTQKLVLGDGINSIADLAGKEIGITAPGAASDILARLAIESEGLSADDVIIRPLGSAAAFSAAFQSGQIDAIATSEPTASRLVETTPGASMGVALKDVTYWTQAGLYANSDWVAANPDATQRFVEALDRAVQAWWEEPDAAQATLESFSESTNAAFDYDEMLKVMTKSLAPLTEETRVPVMKALKENGFPEVDPDDWEILIDNSFVEKLNN